MLRRSNRYEFSLSLSLVLDVSIALACSVSVFSVEKKKERRTFSYLDELNSIERRIFRQVQRAFSFLFVSRIFSLIDRVLAPNFDFSLRSMSNKDDRKFSSDSSSTDLEFLHQQQQTFADDKLPLKQPWTTYFYKADKQRDWKQNVIYLTSLNFVEDFWSFYTHTFALRDLTNGTDYMIFKVTKTIQRTSTDIRTRHVS